MYKVKIYYKDTDAGGVVYYANYLRFFEAARTEFLLERGIDLSTWIERGIHFVVIHTELDYLSSARYGDVLQVETECTSVSGVRLDLINRAVREKDGETMVNGLTRLACIKEKGKPCRIPEEIREVLTRDLTTSRNQTS